MEPGVRSGLNTPLVPPPHPLHIDLHSPLPFVIGAAPKLKNLQTLSSSCSWEQKMPDQQFVLLRKRNWFGLF